MALDNLSLPVDIPWERLCVSEDMIETEVCDREFPYRWRSSVGVFKYEPPEEYQEYEGQTISYLKVVNTVTGFQPDPEEVGLDDRRIDSYWNDPAVIENYKEIVSDYYGCYGAILEVAVTPSDDDVDLDEYPYIVDYQPKKRDLYETVSETGETMSRSLSNVNVRKGTTSTDTHEVVDIFGGFNIAGQGQGAGGAGGGGEFGMTGQWGTRDIDKEEYTNVRTTDRARETRELYSHTTQLTQMYNQLSSYHLGTNRATFFMIPRPHIVQSEETFVNGPRLLEGVQEFFIVVARPEEQDDFCTEAYLETAHIASEPNYEYETSVGTVSLHVEAPCRDTSGSAGDDSKTFTAEDSERYTPPPGWEVDIDRRGGAIISSASGERVRAQEITEIERDHVTIYGRVDSRFVDRQWPIGNECRKGYLDLEVTVYIRKQDPDVVGFDQNLWLTGRGVCCGCEAPTFRVMEPGTVTWETTLKAGPASAKIGADSTLSVSEANELRNSIGRQLIRSRQDVERYPFGEMKFQDTQFLSRTVAKLVRSSEHPDNQPITHIEGLDASIRERVEENAPRASRGWLLEAPLGALEDRFELTTTEAIDLRRGLLGLEAAPPDPKHRWEPPSRRSDVEVTVPDVVGLILEEAQNRIDEADLFVDEISYQDSEKPKDTVVNQYPNADEEVKRGSQVDLVVTTGLSVVIPDVVGDPLSKAIEALREAGIETEPEVQYAPSDDQPKSHVIEVTPEPDERVTPNTDVVLQISSGDEE